MKIDSLKSAIRHFKNAYEVVQFLRSRAGVIEKISISKSLSNCYNRLGELYYNLAKEVNLPSDVGDDVEAMFTKLNLDAGAASSFQESMVNFVECVRYGAISCDLADSIETDLQKENDKKIAVCISALEK
ncbi:Oidioi.mRNA.OKI2018_I69.XSR.g16751.t1.cds [Oikopleura dioica]|uniref:Oidioi.mRNA.OKI2018_I69.XSR.g16751.t1.cds n=1 Tax=Oikopleura dioica TaxID=34765 RepID=A0ABN7SPE2_OIKDI|nr:Oidioi.mRNA.OKI2018_I69.XSR.g16751.t1.cds [Oikopleura dioica]